MVRGVVVVAVVSLGSEGHWRRDMGIDSSIDVS